MAWNSSDIDAAWTAAIWQHATVTAFGANIFNSPVPTAGQSDSAVLRANGFVNYFTCICRRASRPLIMQGKRFDYRLVVTYSLQQENQTTNVSNTVRDRLETVDELVLTALGPTWSDAIDVYDGSNMSDVVEKVIDGVRCWQASYTYNAIKTI